MDPETTDPAAWIIASMILGALIGYAAHAFKSARRNRHITRESWNQARIFYTRRDS